MNNVYDDTPETAPKIHTTLGSQIAAIRALRNSYQFREAREQYLARAKKRRNKDGTVGAPCWLCGQPIDYRLKFPHPRSWVLDHAVPVKQEPALMLNSGNFRSAHCECNNHRGSDAPRIELGEPSEIW
jgi:5-methylcytosine-specific restriction endonuclease McrA